MENKVVCRLCMTCNAEGSTASIFVAAELGVIRDLITLIADVNIEENDGLPKRVCAGCVSQLEGAVRFKKQCEKSDEMFRLLVKNEQLPEVKNEYIVVKVEADHFPDADKSDFNDSSDEEKPLQMFKDTVEKKKRAPCIKHEFECDLCHSVFTNRVLMKNHLVKVHNETPEKSDFMCEYCRRPYKVKKTFENHLKSTSSVCYRIRGLTHLIKIRGDRMRSYNCKLCSYTTKRLQHIADHVASHTKYRHWKCHLCPESYIQHQQLRQHMKIKHGFDNSEETCEYCGKVFRCRELLRCHQNNHKQKNTVQCDICKKLFKGKHTLQCHILRHDVNNRKFSCEICGLLFYTIADMKRHFVKHNENLEKVHKCDICGYRCDRRNMLTKHKSTHSEAPSSACFCATCGRHFASEEKLVSHMRLHTTEAEFKCPHCSRAYYLSKSLKKHISRHCTVAPPVDSCVTCGRYFDSEERLRTHLKLYATKAPMNCPHCTRSYHLLRSLKKHIRIAHKGNTIKAEETVEAKKYFSGNSV